MYSYIQLPHAFASRAFPIHWEGWEKNGVPLCTNRISNFFKNPVLTLAASQRFNPPYFGVPEQSGRQGEHGRRALWRESKQQRAERSR
nr:MAG TPA: hypothetical protein [Caudoviricetes sp.]